MPQPAERFRPPVWYVLAATLVVVMIAASYCVFRTRSGDWLSLWQQVPTVASGPDQGFAFSAATGHPEWTSDNGRPSPALMLEDRRVLSPANAPLADVRSIGEGRFRFSSDRVYWSATDNSDPRTNGRQYSIVYPPIERETAQLLYRVTLGALAVFILVTLIVVPIASIARSLGLLILSLPARFATALEPGPPRPLPRSAVRWMYAACLVAVAITVIATATYLTRVGRWTALWHRAPITSVVPEIGHAYYADIGHDGQSSQLALSPALVLENERPVGPSNALHGDIRTLGEGRFSFWASGVYFAASDNSDPRTNGRTYAIWYPPISRTQSRIIYVLAALIDGFAAVLTLFVISRGGLGARMATMLATGQRRGVTRLAFAGAGGLVLIGLVRATPAIAPFADAAWFVVLALSVVAAAAVRWQFGTELPRRILAVSAVAVIATYVLLAGFSPHRSQGCHTNEQFAVWEAFCLSGDSGSYLSYSIGSTRQPLYPWFIAAMTPPFDAGAYALAHLPGRLVTDTADPVFPVIRGQILLLLAASVVACIALMRLFGSPLPATLFVWLFDHQYFSNGELNAVLTEPLVLTLVFLLFAVFVSYVRKPRPWLIPLAAVCCGGAYLTRQAAAYSGIFVAVMVLHALATSWRRAWPACAAACVAFVAVAAIPDTYGFLSTGNWGQQQTSLQYQYRIAHAMQYLDEEDVRRAPDAESREWMAAALKRRETEHAKIHANIPGVYLRMVYYVDRNLYAVAIPSGVNADPEFMMAIATPILERHWREYLAFGFKFWALGLSWPEVARIGFLGFSAWWVYAAVFGAVIALRDRYALVAASCVLAHWSHVLLASFFAAPIPRMVGASELLVVIGVVTAGWGVALRLSQVRVDGLRRALQSYAVEAREPI